MKKVLLMLLLCSYLVNSCTKENLNSKATRIHQQVLTLDSHTDTPLMLWRSNLNLSVLHKLSQPDAGRLDFPRMKQGGLDAVFFAVFIAQGPRDKAGNQQARDRALSIFEKIHQEVEARPQEAQIALTSGDAKILENESKAAIYLGIENGYAIGTDLDLLQKYYALGARYVTLCHTSNNDICDSSTDAKGAEHNGLSPFGEKVVIEMNKLGMMVDVSHLSDASVEDVLAISSAPIIASHSCALALCDNPRNLSDKLLKEIARKGGVIQVCLFSDYLKRIEQSPERKLAIEKLKAEYQDYSDMPDSIRQNYREKRDEIDAQYPAEIATVSDLVDHIEHIIHIAGINHVGIGSDFDGGGKLADCQDVSEMGNITLELVRRGYNSDQIGKIWGANFLRVFREVEQMREKHTL